MPGRFLECFRTPSTPYLHSAGPDEIVGSSWNKARRLAVQISISCEVEEGGAGGREDHFSASLMKDHLGTLPWESMQEMHDKTVARNHSSQTLMNVASDRFRVAGWGPEIIASPLNNISQVFNYETGFRISKGRLLPRFIARSWTHPRQSVMASWDRSILLIYWSVNDRLILEANIPGHWFVVTVPGLAPQKKKGILIEFSLVTIGVSFLSALCSICK